MTRQERRAAARQAAKELLKAARQETRNPNPETRPSEAPLQANRLNAQASTGPKSAETKAISSQNSFKHGLYSKQLVIKGEDPAALDALKADLTREHQPATETEAILSTKWPSTSGAPAAPVPSKPSSSKANSPSHI